MHEALARVLREPSFARAAQHKSVLMQAHSRSPRQRAAGGCSSASLEGVPCFLGNFARSFRACRDQCLLFST